MKILVVSNQLPIAGRRITNPIIYNLVVGLREKGVFVDTLAVDVTRPLNLAYAGLLGRLIALRLTSEEYDIVHVHFGGLTSAIVALLFSRKLIVSFHGTDLHGGTVSSWKAKVKHFITRIFSSFSASRASRITVVSGNLVEFLSKGDSDKVSVIGTGVSYKEFSPASKQVARATLGLHIGRVYALFSDISISLVKRRDLADAIVARLKTKWDVELLVLSGVPATEVPTYLDACDFVLIVSDKEGSPSIVKEALAMNKPICSVDVGDVADFVERAEGSILLSSRDPDTAASELFSWYKASHEGFEEIASREFFRKEIEQGAVLDAYIEQYRRISSPLI